MVLRLTYSGVVLAAASMGLAQSDSAFDIALPSGLVVTLHETVVPDPGSGLLYLGFLAEVLGEGGLSFADVADDMDVLCETVGLRSASGVDEPVSEVVIRLMGAPVPYGSGDPNVTQFVNSYDVSNGICEWM